MSHVSFSTLKSHWSARLINQCQGDDVIQPSCKRNREEAEPSCRLKELCAIGQKRVQSGAVFWPSAWRSKLCSCHSCQVRPFWLSLHWSSDDVTVRSLRTPVWTGESVSCWPVLPAGRVGHCPRLREEREEERGDAARTRPSDVSAWQPEPSAAAGDHSRYASRVLHETDTAWVLPVSSHPSVTACFLCVSGYNDLKSELKDFLQRFAAEGKVSLTSEVLIL